MPGEKLEFIVEFLAWLPKVAEYLFLICFSRREC